MDDSAGSDSTALSAELEPIYRLEAALKELPQHDPPVRHFFAEGVYCREMTLEKDATCVGKLHRQSHVFMLISGEVTLISHLGRKRIKAPFVMESPAGTKRAFFAHEDSVMVTAHGSKETDLDALELQLIEDDTRLLT